MTLLTDHLHNSLIVLQKRPASPYVFPSPSFISISRRTWGIFVRSYLRHALSQLASSLTTRARILTRAHFLLHFYRIVLSRDVLLKLEPFPLFSPLRVLALPYSWMLINAADFLLSASLPLRDTFQDERRRLEAHHTTTEAASETTRVALVSPRGSKHIVRAVRVALFTVTCVAARRVASHRGTREGHRAKSVRPEIAFSALSLPLSSPISGQVFPLPRRGSRTISNARARHGLNARNRLQEIRKRLPRVFGAAQGRRADLYWRLSETRARMDCSRMWRARAVARAVRARVFTCLHCCRNGAVRRALRTDARETERVLRRFTRRDSSAETRAIGRTSGSTSSTNRDSERHSIRKDSSARLARNLGARVSRDANFLSFSIRESLRSHPSSRDSTFLVSLSLSSSLFPVCFATSSRQIDPWQAAVIEVECERNVSGNGGLTSTTSVM